MNAAASRTSTIMCADGVLGEHIQCITAVAHARSALLIPTSPGALCVAFDSASSAVLAGVEIQQVVAARAAPSAIRIGLATGDVVWNDGVCTGMPVSVAAELRARAEPGADPGQQRRALARGRRPR